MPLLLRNGEYLMVGGDDSPASDARQPASPLHHAKEELADEELTCWSSTGKFALSTTST